MKIAILATLDTKQAEAELLVEELARLEARSAVVDVGLWPTAEDADAAATSAQVARAAGHDIFALREGGRRDRAMDAMAIGAQCILREWMKEGALQGVIGIGGNQGTAIACRAVEALPFGVPKYILSTVASGNVRPYVKDVDMVMSFSVGDLLGGPNAITGLLLRQAAGAVVGMARSTPAYVESVGASVAVTAFGNTHHAVTQSSDSLRRAGVTVVPFHASGPSGSAMERFVRAGLFDGVLDLTTHELLAELYPEDIYTPVRPGRLTAAAENAVPQVVAPGGLEYHCFGAVDSVPSSMRNRAIHYHNPYNTNVRASHAELTLVGEEMAVRLNRSRAPCAVVIPLLGWSGVGSPGQPLHDLEANDAFIRSLERNKSSKISIYKVDATINDLEFSVLCAELLQEYMSG